MVHVMDHGGQRQVAPFDVVIWHETGRTAVYLRGELDASTAPHLPTCWTSCATTATSRSPWTFRNWHFSALPGCRCSSAPTRNCSPLAARSYSPGPPAWCTASWRSLGWMLH